MIALRVGAWEAEAGKTLRTSVLPERTQKAALLLPSCGDTARRIIYEPQMCAGPALIMITTWTIVAKKKNCVQEKIIFSCGKVWSRMWWWFFISVRILDLTRIATLEHSSVSCFFFSYSYLIYFLKFHLLSWKMKGQYYDSTPRKFNPRLSEKWNPSTIRKIIDKDLNLKTKQN